VGIKRIGVMTGGGDCPGLNAVIRGVVLGARARGWEVLGIEDATHGLVDLDYRSPHGNRWLTERDVERILPRGGTILGTSNKSDPFEYVIHEDGQKKTIDVSDKVVANYHKLGLDALVSIGGDGSMRIAQKLIAKGMKIVGVPKTIDQDLACTDYTFGHQTAVQTATDCIDRLQDTAESHDRVMLVEVMGRDAGWIALHAAIAGGAHACLIHEIPYRLEPILKKIVDRRESGYPFSIVVVAEGARPAGGQQTTVGPKEAGAMVKLGGAAQRLEAELRPKLDLEVRSTVLGHLQRGGSPVQFDRILGTRFGIRAVELLEEGKFGHMVALRTPDIVGVKIEDAIRLPANVDPKGQMVRTARSVGIVFGDE
jgi:ATP-dependent phosphofructokinase / diphosphate-dependent phosphofructokinase